MAHSPAETLFAQVAADNPTFPRFLTPANSAVDTPIALTGDADGKNTSVVVTGTPGSGLKDSVTLKYNRVGLTDMIAASANPSNIVPATGQVTLADMIVSFNSRYGAHLASTDVLDASIADLTGGFRGLTLTPVAGHLLYNGAAEVKYHGTYPTLTLTGSFATPSNVGSAYSSSIAIAGGNGTYVNPRLGTGTLPAGLTLSLSGTSLVLSGASTTMGSFGFTVKIDSNDGQTATSTTQTVIIDGELNQLITHSTLTGLVTADVTSNRTATQAVYLRLNADNPTLPVALSAANSSLTTLTALSGDPSLRNTSLLVSGTAGGYVNNITVFYNRLDLTTLANGAIPNITWIAQTASSDLLPAINTALGTNLQNSDIVVENLPTNPNDGSTTAYALKANTASLAFIGQVNVTLVTAAKMVLTGTLTPNSLVGTAYSSTLTINNGTGPFTVATPSGTGLTSIIPGLTATVSGNTITLAGTPTSAAQRNTLFTVTSSDGQTATATMSMIAAASTAQASYDVWNPTTTSTSFYTIGSQGRLVTRNDGGNGSQRPARSKNSVQVKTYMEMNWAVKAASSPTLDGLGLSVLTSSVGSESVSTIPGFTANVPSFYLDISTGTIRYKNAAIRTITIPTENKNDIYGIAIDPTIRSAVKVWISHNGTWLDGGNPSTGLSPLQVLDWSAVTSGAICCITAYGFGSAATITSVQLGGGVGQMVFTAPTGFVVGGLPQ